MLKPLSKIIDLAKNDNVLNKTIKGYLVSQDDQNRKYKDINIINYKNFLENLQS